MPIQVINNDVEKLARALSKAEIHPMLAECIIEMHESQVALQKLVNELMTHNAKLLQAVQVLSNGFKVHNESLQKIERKFGDQHRDLIKDEKFDG